MYLILIFKERYINTQETIIFLTNIIMVLCTKINLIYFQDGSNNELINKIVEEFNIYSIKNNLDITLVENVYSSITTEEAYSETLDYLLSTKSIKYDLIINDIVYSKKFANYLTNLNEYIPQSLLDKYSYGILKDTNIVNNNMVTLVINI
ncbi:hypothetical protein LY90DRAFT_499013 [Neocallimastix californiae]|uniref:Uncharacterized protein n=1 Tax=Neocallimastix californiae TaxID=1754190 RepID=A0A1Y2FPI7_9FUNG|nr:hypothetical protein LY90DRAFT_499013 [Neocallimastix californiae]|eukprot:ORY85901.1 hypothetical protein LY90DRAFT_499013 [Neocallimastix californiae]